MEYDSLYPLVRKELSKLLSSNQSLDTEQMIVQSGVGGPKEVNEAQKIVESLKFKNKLCKGLTTFKNDIWDFSKTVTASYVTLVAGGIITASINLPVVLAAVTVMIFLRIGIDVYCQSD